MSTRIDYTAEEWSAVSAAPQAARLLMGIAISAAHSADANESVSVGQHSNVAAAADVPELIRVVISSIRCGGGRPMLQDGLSNDGVKYSLLNTVKTAVRAVERRSPVEVEPYKAWLASVAAKVCRASNDHSRLVDGRHSRDESEGVQQLAGVLAVGARQARRVLRRLR